MGATTEPKLRSLSAVVQKNCHIADARHATDYTLCIYLLKMREYFRWERGHALGETLESDQIGEWLRERERLWESLDEASYEPLELDGARFDPFDTEAVNAALLPRGLVYSGGIGRRAAAHFFLGRLERSRRVGGYTLLVSGQELARDLTAPPAMTLGKTIFVRRESLRRMIWEKFQEWRWQERDNAMGRAVACYPFDRDLDAALDAMTERELETVTLHEIGEVWAGDALGPAWEDMLVDIARTPAELIARAVRDHLADAVSTLPALLRDGAEPSLHFWVANLSGMRREIVPSLPPAYERWVHEGDDRPLRALVGAAAGHWLHVAEQLLALHAEHGADAAEPIHALAPRTRL